MRIATLMSGTLIAQIIMLGFMPLLTRLYTPEEFGLYSLFFSVASIVGLVSSLKYDQAIMLPKSNKDAEALLFLSVLITSSVVFLVALVIFLFKPFILNYYIGLEPVIWMLPYGVLLIGLLQIFNTYSSRQQFYKKMSTVRVVNAASVVSIQSLSKSLLEIKKFVFSFNGFVLEVGGFVLTFNGFILNFSGFILDFDGLITGKLVADFICLFLLLKYHFKKKTIQLKNLSRRRLIINAKRYEQFPKYQSFTVFLNAISQNMPILLLGMLYSPEIAGFYALTVRVLKTPTGLIGASTKEVYYQRASKMHAQGADILDLYLKTTKGLSKIFMIPLLAVLLFGEPLFEIVFGEKWGVSGIMAQILILWFAVGFVNSASIVTYSILGVQKTQMKLEVLSLILRFLAIYISYQMYPSYLVSVASFMVVSVGINSFSLIYIYRRLKKMQQVLEI